MKLDGIKEKVFLDRYALKGAKGELLEHTPEEMWTRVARGIAKNEKSKDRKYWEKKFYGVMEGFKFVPGGRILSGAGTNYQVTYFNCFVIPSPRDSRQGILESLKQLVEIQARSGGVGLNLSSLRPKGARVKKVNGTSSGPVNWAELFSVATHDIVQQGGSRRGATMLMLWDWHPDIEEFITVKQDLTKINGANLSVCISDSFMDAVKSDKDWDLVYPDLDDPQYDEKWNGELDEWKRIGSKIKVYKTVKARYLWNLICEAAWRSAEPGLHFLERSNKRSNTYYFEKLIATNPCVTGDTLVSTGEGLVRMKEVVESHFEGGKRFGGNMPLIIDQRTLSPESIGTLPGRGIKFFDNGIKDVLRLTTKSGFEVTATLDHKVLTPNGWIELQKLKIGDKILIQSGKGEFGKEYDLPFVSESKSMPPKWTKELGQVLGWLVGDGWVRAGDKNCRVGFTFGKGDENLLSYLKGIINGWYGKNIKAVKRVRNTTHLSYHGKGLVDFFLKLGVKPVKADEKEVPELLYTAPEEAVIGFLQGLFTSDGTVGIQRVNNTRYVRLTSKSRLLLKGVQLLLLNLGIFSKIYDRSRSPRANMFQYTTVDGKERSYSTDGILYELQISRNQIPFFLKRVGFMLDKNSEKVEELLNHKNYYQTMFEDAIASIVPSGKQRVYDLTEEKSYTFITNGIVSFDCGEQPLGAWAVCNLGAMNLAAYVKPFGFAQGGNEKFDYKNFGRDVRVAMRFMDNVIDQTYYFFPENEKCAKDIRRTGLGIMGLGDALIKMRVRYGSEESLPIIEKIFKTLRDNAYEASSDLAFEKGAFPKFDKTKYLKGYHVKALPKQIQKKIAKRGIRNAVLLTIAPTGTTSLVAGVTSGVEPVYEFTFIRKDRTGIHTMHHPLFEEWGKISSPPAGELRQRPAYFVSANDLSPLEHAKVQAVAQEYIDSSISKTVNAPNSHTVEDVRRLYMAAYDLGLKGITYMRDGSREGVLSRMDDNKKEEVKKDNGFSITKKPVVPRPMHLEGVTYQIDTPVGKTYITINHNTLKEPFEVFITIGKSGSDVAAMADALGRMVSLNLRLTGGLSPKERIRQVVAQLVGIGGARSVGFGKDKVRSLPDAVAKVLSMHYGFSVNGTVEDKKATNNGHVAEGLETRQNIGVQETSDVVKLQQLALVGGTSGVFAKDPDLLGTESATSLYDICPECGGASLAYEEGCRKCYNCGHAEC